MGWRDPSSETPVRSSPGPTLVLPDGAAPWRSGSVNDQVEGSHSVRARSTPTDEASDFTDEVVVVEESLRKTLTNSIGR